MKIRNPRTGEDDYEITPLDGATLASCATEMRQRLSLIHI
jgi:hypothetical protein